jgi:hypothetical protein
MKGQCGKEIIKLGSFATSTRPVTDDPAWLTSERGGNEGTTRSRNILGFLTLALYHLTSGWILPGQDPDEVAKPLAPPPITTVAADSNPDPVPKQEGPVDPLAAMMAPPSRVPSSMKRAGGIPKAIPGRYPPGVMMPSNGSQTKTPGATAGGGSEPPPFAVFTPKTT